MLDARQYAEHFPDEYQSPEMSESDRASMQKAVKSSPLLLAALSRLEREFRDILRAQNPAGGRG